MFVFFLTPILSFLVLYVSYNWYQEKYKIGVSLYQCLCAEYKHLLLASLYPFNEKQNLKQFFLYSLDFLALSESSRCITIKNFIQISFELSYGKTHIFNIICSLRILQHKMLQKSRSFIQMFIYFVWIFKLEYIFSFI